MIGNLPRLADNPALTYYLEIWKTSETLLVVRYRPSSDVRGGLYECAAMKLNGDGTFTDYDSSWWFENLTDALEFAETWSPTPTDGLGCECFD